MNLDRLKMLASLEVVKPALASKDLIEELTHAWFDGETVMAYNDADLGIQVPFKSPFTGGIRGALLLGLLHNSRAKEVTLEPGEEGNMVLKASRTRAKLAVLDASRMKDIWQFPEIDAKRTFDLTVDFITALKSVMVSVGNDTSIPEKMGVTMLFDKKLYLYTTDSKTIARTEVALPDGAKPKKAMRVIVPTAFCEQLLRLCSQGGVMELREDCALAGNEDGVNIYARLIDAPKPLDFPGTVEKHLEWPKGAKMEVPERLSLALERALVLLDGLPAEAVNMDIAGGKLKISATVEGRGELKDFITVPENAPELSIKIDPALLKRALPLTKHMVFGKESVRMLGEAEFIYLASTR